MTKKIPDFASHKKQAKGPTGKPVDDSALKATIKGAPKVSAKPQATSSKSGRRGS